MNKDITESEGTDLESKGISALQRQVRMVNVLQMLLFDRNAEKKRPYTLQECLDTYGIARNTWYAWKEKGWLDEVMRQMHEAVNHYAQTMVIGMYPSIISAMAALAQGNVPVDEYGVAAKVKPTAASAVEAAKFLQTNVIDRMSGQLAGANPHQHLEDYTPGQIHIYAGDIDNRKIIVNQDKAPEFIYKGNADGNELVGTFLDYDEYESDEEKTEADSE